MALPDLIEIVPLTAPVRAEITVPGSKSITNRALVLAALAGGETTLTGALWSEDTQVMVECLQELGFMVNVADDPAERCNRTITVYGRGGVIPGGGTAENPLELFVGNAGTAARFLAAMVCLGSGVYRLHGVPRMHERPQAALFAALRELGYRVEATGDKLPATIYGQSPIANRQSPMSCTVSIAESSQFASALLLCAGQGGWDVKVVGENAEESPYVAMTLRLIAAFPKRGGRFQIEPDASSGSYFWAAASMVPGFLSAHQADDQIIIDSASVVKVMHWPNSGLQIDEKFPHLLLSPLLQALSEISETTKPEDVFGDPKFVKENSALDWLHDWDPLKTAWIPEWTQVSRRHHAGDSIMTGIVMATFGHISRRFWHLERLRVQECERVVALRTELTKCGAKVIEEGDTLTVFPSELHGAEIETYNDHRMAMCFAILGLKVPGIRLKNPACVKKTFPNFFQKLAAAAPHGLGAEIWEVKAGQRTRQLSGEDLFAA